jgi:UDP-GlcNAc:undecaprenyl-phosphate/decaprenyl-phosphate GlcNAc-1-phosphate transferase
MREYLLVASITAALCYLLTPIIRGFAMRAGAYVGLRARDIHTTITPRWGGIAMWGAMGLTLLIVGHLPLAGKSFDREAIGIFLAATFVLIMGALDDRYDLDALTKFAGQALAGGILLIYGVQILWLPVNGILILPPAIGQVLTVFFVMVVINAINFVDGLDGLATGIVAICAGAFFVYSYLLAVINGLNRAGASSLITAIVIGMCLGFLPYNYHPAKIFMGDSGAMFLGVLLSASAITLTGQIDANAVISQRSGSPLLPLLLPLAVLAIPLLDLGMAIFRRVGAGKSPFAADREHLHHRLMKMGMSHRRTTFILYLWSAMFALPIVIAAFTSLWISLLAALAILVFSLIVIREGARHGKLLERDQREHVAGIGSHE